jgi:hypothetical protein
VQYHKVTGAQINNLNIWATLAHKPMYAILNVAVGGNWVRTDLSLIKERHANAVNSPATPTPALGEELAP